MDNELGKQHLQAGFSRILRVSFAKHWIVARMSCVATRTIYVQRDMLSALGISGCLEFELVPNVL